MPIDDLPNQLIIPLKSEIVDRYIRDARFRSPGAVIVEGTKEFADAKLFADLAAPLYYNAKNIGDYAANVNKKGKALDAELIAAGTSRLPPVGGSGYVKIAASAGGGTIFQGDEIKDLSSGLRFTCLATKLYANGESVPVIGKDTGPATNLKAGTILQWTFPRPGISPLATIVQQSDGSGFSGGRFAESDDEANARLRALRAKPPASGNDAEYQKAAAEVPGITIQQCFTYSAIFASGSIGIAFTLRPGTPGGSRVPNATQIAAMRAYLKGRFPADDQIYMMTIVEEPVDIVYELSWAPGSSDWMDANPWPQVGAGDVIAKVDGAVTPTATTFRLSITQPILPPKVGQTIAFYDQANGAFKKKRILSFTEVVTNKSWDIVCDTSNDATDTDYIPLVNQITSPWANSLQDLAVPTSTYFDIVGPGELFDPLPDPGLRQKRDPRSPFAYESAVTNRLLTPLFKLASIHDIELLLPDVPYETPIGVPGVSVKILTLNAIAAYPQR